MQIISLSDNISHCECGCEHGLSLYVVTSSGTRLLFDTGQSSLFASNAIKLGIDLSEVDIAVLSHGHYDHGGGLGEFLKINSKAGVYARYGVFDDHWSIREDGLKYIGLDKELEKSGRFVFCDDVFKVSEELTLFSTDVETFPRPAGNDFLLGPDKVERDDFLHEQSLIISENGKNILIGGCAHCGISNILTRAEQLCGGNVTHVFSGMHLAKGEVTTEYVSNLTEKLMARADCIFVTMHCTGESGFAALKERMGDRISYLSCGETVEI